MADIHSPSAWPELSYQAWRDTCTTLHLWCQIAGKVRLALTPWINHSWHATLYVTARGLGTSPIPHGGRVFEILFDFIDHDLRIQTGDGAERRVPLAPTTIAGFHAAVLGALAELGLAVEIHGTPSELPDPVPFKEDHAPRVYDRADAHRFWRVLLQVDRVFKQFRTGFLGKVSPVHLFWGSFDLAVTRFSGRTAPRHKGGIPHLPDAVAQEAYSHEVSSAGFWPGGGDMDAAFYSYAYPQPADFPSARVRPAAAGYHQTLGEFVLPYEAVRTAASPDDELLGFLQSTYDAAATTGAWDRAALECATGRPGVVRSF
jgi:hypothetical protein